VLAEDTKPASHKPRKKRVRAARAPRPEKPTKPAKGDKKPERVATSPDSATAAAQAAAASTNAQIVKEGDTSVKVMSFEGLGIEGRLKSPQLVYFVQRVQAEFERPVLPHRSFMPELADTSAREPLR
jgi:hypothetical protein